jgi:hypothetical protein
MARFKKGSKEAKAYMAKIRGKKSPAKKAAVKKVSVLDKVVRKGNKTDVKYTRVSGIGQISLHEIGGELISLEFKINRLKSDKKLVRTASQKKELQSKILIYQKQFKALKVYLNTRAKFI